MKKPKCLAVAILLAVAVSLVPAGEVGCTSDGRKTVIEGMTVCAGSGVCVMYEN